MNLKENIYLMLLKSELEKNNGDYFKSFYKIDRKKSTNANCDYFEFCRQDLVGIAKDLANAIDENSEDVIIE